MVTKQEFAQSIKAKYPQYANVDDNILTEKMLAKYPQYAEKIDIESQFTPEQELRIESERKKEASIPSKLVRSGVGLLGIKVKPYSKMLEEEYQGGQNALKQLAKTTGKIGVQLAPLAVPMGGGVLGQAGKSALAYGASKTGEKLLEGKKPTEALKEGLKSGAGAGAFTGAFGLAGKAGQALAKTKLGQSTIKGLKAGASGAGEFLTGVPKELYEHALNKPEILKGKTSKDIIKREYEHAGKLAQNTISKLKTKAGEALKQEKKALTGQKQQLDVDDIIKNIDDEIKGAEFDGIQTLEKSDLQELNKIKEQLNKLKIGTKQELKTIEQLPKKEITQVLRRKDVPKETKTSVLDMQNTRKNYEKVANDQLKQEMNYMKDEIQSSTAGKRGINYDDAGNVVRADDYSTFPNWFRESGLKSKNEFVKALNPKDKNHILVKQAAENRLLKGTQEVPANKIYKEARTTIAQIKQGEKDVLSPFIKKVTKEIPQPPSIQTLISKYNAGITPGQAHAIKTNIDKLVDYDPQTVKKVSTIGEKALKNIRHNINQKIRTNNTSYAQANDKFASLAQIQERLKTHLKDERVANALKNLDQKDETTIGLFKELDALAPKGRKFLEKVKDTKAREAFNELIPGKGYTTGGTQGVGNIARAGILGALYKNPLAAGAVATTFSPVVHRGAIKAASNIPKLADITKKAVPYYMNRKGENK